MLNKKIDERYIFFKNSLFLFFIKNVFLFYEFFSSSAKMDVLVNVLL